MARVCISGKARMRAPRIGIGAAALAIIGAVIIVCSGARGAPPQPFPVSAVPGTPAEQAILVNNARRYGYG